MIKKVWAEQEKKEKREWIHSGPRSSTACLLMHELHKPDMVPSQSAHFFWNQSQNNFNIKIETAFFYEKQSLADSNLSRIKYQLNIILVLKID